MYSASRIKADFRKFKTAEKARAFLREPRTVSPSPSANSHESDCSVACTPSHSIDDADEGEDQDSDEDGDDGGDENDDNRTDEEDDEETDEEHEKSDAEASDEEVLEDDDDEKEDEENARQSKLKQVRAQGFMTTVDGALIVYTDGSAKGHRLPGVDGTAGCGVWWGHHGEAQKR